MSAGLLNYTRKRNVGSHGNYVAMNHAETDRQSRRVVYSPPRNYWQRRQPLVHGCYRVRALAEDEGGSGRRASRIYPNVEQAFLRKKNRVVQYFRPIQARYLFGICSLPLLSS